MAHMDSQLVHVSGSDGGGMAVAQGARDSLGAEGEVVVEVGGGGGGLEVVRELLEWGADVDARRLGDNVTALMTAAARQRGAEVRSAGVRKLSCYLLPLKIVS